MNQTTEPFPLDWDEFVIAWRRWAQSHGRDVIAAQRPDGFPESPNMLADDLIGWFTVPNGTVELSALTMPAFGERPRRTVRLIGYSFAPHLEGETGVVETFADLEEVLGLTTSLH